LRQAHRQLRDKNCSDDHSKPGDPTPLKVNFMLELNYAYQNAKGGIVREYFLVDVVDFNRLDEFLKSIETEVSAAQFMLTRN
jgi:hypothetical protein